MSWETKSRSFVLPVTPAVTALTRQERPESIRLSRDSVRLFLRLDPCLFGPKQRLLQGRHAGSCRLEGGCCSAVCSRFVHRHCARKKIFDKSEIFS